MNKVLNFNIGVLGHVDSGKTSLSYALSSIASTAAFDKNPQSKERGITIDLGFSSFCIEAPLHIEKEGFEKVQYTLVDCPGHASLIRTIIGGVHIIDAMMLVIDVSKGIQTQTAECIILGEIMCKKLIVVLNKIDLISEENLNATCDKITKRIKAVLQKTKFMNAKIVSMSANPGGGDIKQASIGIDKLINEIKTFTYIPIRDDSAPLSLSVDHCFAIKGQGTVITGTILQGKISVNSNIEMPMLKMSKKVKSIQMFRQPVEKAGPGDRVGICVTQFEPKLIERSLIGSSESIKLINGFITRVNLISYYKPSIKSKGKYHVSLGHDTVMADITLFSTKEPFNGEVNFDREYLYVNEINNESAEEKVINNASTDVYAIVEFNRTVLAMKDSLFIASKLDMDINANKCRLAFWGKLLVILQDDYKSNVFPSLKIYKNKSKEGIVDRMNTEDELIVRNLFKKGTDISLFIGLKVFLSTGESGIIDGFFGLSGKTKIRMAGTLKPNTLVCLNELNGNRKKSKKNNEKTNLSLEPIYVHLLFKKYVLNGKKRNIVQN